MPLACALPVSLLTVCWMAEASGTGSGAGDSGSGVAKAGVKVKAQAKPKGAQFDVGKYITQVVTMPRDVLRIDVDLKHGQVLHLHPQSACSVSRNRYISCSLLVEFTHNKGPFFHLVLLQDISSLCIAL